MHQDLQAAGSASLRGCPFVEKRAPHFLAVQRDDAARAATILTRKLCTQRLNHLILLNWAEVGKTRLKMRQNHSGGKALSVFDLKPCCQCIGGSTLPQWIDSESRFLRDRLVLYRFEDVANRRKHSGETAPFSSASFAKEKRRAAFCKICQCFHPQASLGFVPHHLQIFIPDAQGDGTKL